MSRDGTHTFEDRSQPHDAAGADDRRSLVDLRVLLVDDDLEDLLILRDLIETGDRSVRCDTVSTYDEGRIAILDGGYDACLVDYRLGARSGIDLIRETHTGAAGPLILLTGVGNPAIDDASLAAGAADYLTKRDLTADAARRSIRYAVEMWRSRRQAELERAKYRSLFDGVPVGLFRTTPEGVLLEVNATAVSMLGSPSRDALVGKRLDEVTECSESLPGLIATLTVARPPGDTDVELRRVDGSSIWVTLSLRPVRSTNGIEWVEWAMTDVTRRKQAERKVALQGTLLDQVRSAVIVTDADGVCTFWNRHAEEMYGWRSIEAVGRSIVEMNVAEDQAEHAAEIMAEINRTGHWEGEFQVRRRDGSILPAQVHNSLLHDEEGRVAGVVGVSLDLTATKEREAAMRRYQDLVTAAFDSSPIAKAIVSPEGRIVSCNQALAGFLAMPIEDLAGVHFADFTHPDDVDIDVDQFDMLLKGGAASYTIDKRYVRPNGGTVWGRLQASLIRDESGEIIYGIGQVVDITERKAAEDRIRFQASLLDQVHHAVMATDLSGSVIYWNRHAEEMYGWSVEEMLGRNVFEVTAPNANPDDLADVARSLAERGVWEGEVELTRRDGSTFPAWASDTVLVDESGTPVGVVGTKVDLTDVRSAERRADEQAALNQTLLEAVAVPLALVDSRGAVTVSNRSWDEMVTGETGHLPPCLTDDTRHGFVAELRQGIESVLEGRTERFILEYECPEGSQERWIRTTVIPTADGGALISHWDITDERIARAGLEQTIRAKDQFIASISHELRTPLTVVVGLAETIRSGEFADEERAEFEDLLAEQAQEIALIVEDLLVAGRLESDTLTIRPSEVDLAHEAQTVITPLIRSHDLEVVLDLPSDLPKAHADGLRVRQILRNLVTNAIRYGRPPISISATTKDGLLVVSVTDHGNGIPSDAIHHMFQPYARFGASDGQPLSVGLGLHVARRLAHLMSGDLTYRREGGTTVFVLTLPMAESTAR